MCLTFVFTVPLLFDWMCQVSLWCQLFFVFLHFLSQHVFLPFQLEKSFSQKKTNEMLELMKNAFIAATKYLQKNLPLESTLSCWKTCLSLTVRNKNWAIHANGRIAIGQRFYQQEKIPNKWYQIFFNKNFKCLDSYWFKILDIKSEVCLKELELFSKYVKTCLSLHHENASIQHSLSDNKKTLTTKIGKLTDSTVSAGRACRGASDDDCISCLSCCWPRGHSLNIQWNFEALKKQ